MILTDVESFVNVESPDNVSKTLIEDLLRNDASAITRTPEHRGSGAFRRVQVLVHLSPL